MGALHPYPVPAPRGSCQHDSMTTLRAGLQAGRPAGAAPTRAALHEAALAHLSRFASTEAGLLRVLDRRVDRWARRAEQDGQEAERIGAAAAAARQAARDVVQALVKAGVVSDAAYAGMRSRSLARVGRSRRGTLAYLTARGVAPALARDVLVSPEAELSSALAYARRRRLGPFRPPDLGVGADRRPDRLKELAAFARAGFPAGIAARVLTIERLQAEELLAALRQDLPPPGTEEE